MALLRKQVPEVKPWVKMLLRVRRLSEREQLRWKMYATKKELKPCAVTMFQRVSCRNVQFMPTAQSAQNGEFYQI